MIPVAIYFPRNSYLVESFNIKLEAFATSGLIEFWASAHTNMKYLNVKFTNTEPKKLSLGHLSGTNQILIGGLVVSTAIFIGEMLWFRFKKLKIIKFFMKNK